MSRPHWISTFCRVFCGIVFVVHGTPKIMNLAATTEMFAGMGFPGWMAIPIALLFFNAGVELGQILFIAVVLAVVALLRRARVPHPRWAELSVPYAIGSLAMFWVIQRIAAFA